MSILTKIIEVKKDEVARLRREYTISRFTDSELFEKETLTFINHLIDNDDIGIIAEIKKASPSRGLIREDFDHMKIADTYFENEVNAVSILTDRHFFQGDIAFLKEIAQIKTSPLLRKDFIIDEFQIYEARSNGADIILLIAEVLSENQIQELSHAAYELNLEVLLEFHSEDQISKINFDFNKLIGVNNRNLETFNTDLGSTYTISEKLPDDIILVSESGIKIEENIALLRKTKTKAILVGEHLMSSLDIDRSLKELIDWCHNAG